MALQEQHQSPSTQSALTNATAGRPDGGKGAPEGGRGGGGRSSSGGAQIKERKKCKNKEEEGGRRDGGEREEWKVEDPSRSQWPAAHQKSKQRAQQTPSC